MLDRSAMIRELASLVEAGGAGDLRRVAAHFKMPSGRAWKDIPDGEVATLHRFTVGGEPLPVGPATAEEIAAEPFTDTIPF